MIFHNVTNWIVVNNILFIGEILAKFDLKNIMSTYTKDFPWKTMAPFHQILKNSFWNC